MNDEQLNSVIDALLQRLYKRWPNDDVSICHYRNPRGELLWIMNTIDLGQCQLQWSDDKIWINSESGNVLRIKATDLVVNESCQNKVAHADIYVNGMVELCIPKPS